MSTTLRILTATAIVAAFSLAVAQADESPEIAIAQAVAVLNASSFHYTYSVWPAQGGSSPVTGEGDFDRSTQSFRYSVETDPNDATIDHGSDGLWLLVGGAMYHDSGTGWQPGGFDFNYLASTTLIAPFENYQLAGMLGSPEDGSLEPIQLLGIDDLEGAPAAHYRFATTEIETFGTAVFEAWVVGEPATPELVALQRTGEDGHLDRVTYSAIGEPVTIAAP